MFLRISLSIKQKLYLLGVVCLLCALSLAGTGLLFSGAGRAGRSRHQRRAVRAAFKPAGPELAT